MTIKGIPKYTPLSPANQEALARVLNHERIWEVMYRNVCKGYEVALEQIIAEICRAKPDWDGSS